jgi:hypothetical protein
MLHVAIWTLHGAKGKNVPVAGSREMIKAIKNLGGNPLYTNILNGGHQWEIRDDRTDTIVK